MRKTTLGLIFGFLAGIIDLALLPPNDLTFGATGASGLTVVGFS